MEKLLQNARTWAETQFGGALLGDRRLTNRLVLLGEALSRTRSGTLPKAVSGNAELKGAYRLLNHLSVSHEKIIEGHVQATREACRQPGVYLLIEDRTSLNYSGRAIEDLGPIGDGQGQGFLLHSTLAVRDEGEGADGESLYMVLGLWAQRRWIRPKQSRRRGRSRKALLSEHQESDYWAESVAEQSPAPEEVTRVFVADRDADAYEVYGRCRSGDTRFVIRGREGRKLADGSGTWEKAVGAAPEIGRYTLSLRSRPGQAARKASIAVRSLRLELQGPWRPGGGIQEPFFLNVVEAREVDPPAGVEAIHWLLATDLPCGTLEEARRVIRYYSKRWLIEEYHKALKSGVGMEESQLETAEGIFRLLGILAITATRLLQLKELGRARAEQPVASSIFSEMEQRALEAKRPRPKGGWTYGSLIRALAGLGGYLGRKNDGHPGWLTIWRGWQYFSPLSEGFRLAWFLKRCGE